MYIYSLHLHLCRVASRSRLGSGIRPACFSLRLPETNKHSLSVCLACWVVCMNAVLHIPTTTPPPNSLILFSFSHPRLPLISHDFSISPPFILFFLLLLQQIPCFFHLFTHCRLRVLRKCYIMHFKLSQCMYYGYGEDTAGITGFDKE